MKPGAPTLLPRGERARRKTRTQTQLDSTAITRLTLLTYTGGNQLLRGLEFPECIQTWTAPPRVSHYRPVCITVIAIRGLTIVFGAKGAGLSEGGRVGEWVGGWVGGREGGWVYIIRILSAARG